MSRWLHRCRTPHWLAAGVFLVYFTTSSGGFEVSDAVLRYRTAQSWLEGRGGALAPDLAWEGASVGPDGRVFSFYAPLQSALMVPFLIAVRTLPELEIDRSVIETFAISLGLFPLVSTVAVLLIFAALRQLGYGERPCLAATLAIALGSLFWYYARMGQEENLVALALALWLYGAGRLVAGNPWPATLMALGGASALAARWATAPILVVLLFLTAVLLVRFRGRVRGADLTLAFCVIVVGLGLLLAYNAARFGGPFETGYGLYFEQLERPMFALEGSPSKMAALLFSPYRGLLLYSPVVLFAAWAFLPPARMRFPLLHGAAPLALLAALVTAATFYAWTGGHSWGPRYLVAPLVLLGPILARFFDRWPRTLPLLLALGLMQLLSVLLPASTEEYHRYNLLAHEDATCSPWTVSCSPLYLRPAFALRAAENTLVGRPGRTLRDRPTVPAELVLETSDYRTIFWWPFRIAFRLEILPLWIAWIVVIVLVSLASFSLFQAHRST